MRARRGLGMVLHRKSRKAAMPEAFQSLIIQVDVRQFDLTLVQRVRIDRKAMILSCDFHLPGSQVFYRLIAAPVAEFQFIGFAAEVRDPSVGVPGKFRKQALVPAVCGCSPTAYARGSGSPGPLERKTPSGSSKGYPLHW